MAVARCAVGLLTWNGERDAARCARNVLAQDETPTEICWVDNGSTDATVARVREAAPEFPPPILLPQNIGFCVGHNLAFSKTAAPYYLALNQDAALAPDYVRRLCDWMDAEPDLALVSGLILQGELEDAAQAFAPGGTIYSAGMAMGRGRFPFELRMGRPMRDEDRARRRVPAVTGAALMIRRSAAEALAAKPGELFPPEFFAYFEEVDLALRAARAGMACGVDGSALAWHAARGQGGAADPAIRAHYFKNHWLLSLRNDSLGDLLRESPYILKGELLHYLPRYLASPAAAARGLALALSLAPWARRSRRDFEKRFPNAATGRKAFYRDSIAALRLPRR